MFPVPTRDKLAETLVQYLERYQRPEIRCRRIRLDRAGENIANDLKLFCTSNGTFLEYTGTDQHQSNGATERLFKSLLDKAWPTLRSSGVHERYWPEIYRTINYLRNRSPSSVLEGQITPYEVWYGDKPSLQHIRRLFSHAFVLRKPGDRKKMQDTKTYNGWLVGYNEESTSLYRVLLPSGHIIESPDVCIVENLGHNKPGHDRTFPKMVDVPLPAILEPTASKRLLDLPDEGGSARQRSISVRPMTPFFPPSVAALSRTPSVAPPSVASHRPVVVRTPSVAPVHQPSVASSVMSPSSPVVAPPVVASQSPVIASPSPVMAPPVVAPQSPVMASPSSIVVPQPPIVAEDSESPDRQETPESSDSETDTEIFEGFDEPSRQLSKELMKSKKNPEEPPVTRPALSEQQERDAQSALGVRVSRRRTKGHRNPSVWDDHFAVLATHSSLLASCILASEAGALPIDIPHPGPHRRSSPVTNKDPDSFIAPPEPRSFREARKSTQWGEWKTALQREISSHNENNTWTLVPLSPGTYILDGKWVLKLKLGPHNEIVRYKARWVVRGFEQIEGVDYSETFASVVKPMTYKMLFAIAAAKDWEIEQMDVQTAFLYGDIDTDVYVCQPEGFVSQEHPDWVCKLNKALYSLKQAPRI